MNLSIFTQILSNNLKFLIVYNFIILFCKLSISIPQKPKVNNNHCDHHHYNPQWIWNRMKFLSIYAQLQFVSVSIKQSTWPLQIYSIYTIFVKEIETFFDRKIKFSSLLSHFVHMLIVFETIREMKKRKIKLNVLSLFISGSVELFFLPI